MPAYVPCYIFSFSNSVCFSSIYRSLSRISTAVAWIRNIRRRTLPKVWVGNILVRSVQSRGNKLILTVKMKTGHPVDDQFGCEFPAICNHCRDMTAWNHKNWMDFFSVFAYFGKKTPYCKFFRILFRKFSPPASLIDVVVFKCRKKIYDGKSAKSCVIYRTKNEISAQSQTVATARIVPKICQGRPPTSGSQCSRFHSNRFTFGRAERVKTVLLPHRVFAW